MPSIAWDWMSWSAQATRGLRTPGPDRDAAGEYPALLDSGPTGGASGAALAALLTHGSLAITAWVIVGILVRRQARQDDQTRQVESARAQAETSHDDRASETPDCANRSACPGAYPRPLVIRDRRAPLNLRNSRHVATLATPPGASVGWSPLRLFVLLIGSESLAIIACSVLLTVIGPAGQETGIYAEAAIAGLGVAVLFALIRPMIRFSTASPRGTAIIAISVP